MADAVLLLLTPLWGSTFVVVKAALEAASPPVFLALRFGLATLALAVVWALRRPARTPHLVLHGVVLGATLFAGFALQTFGLSHTTPARSGFLTGLAVLVVPVIARFVLRRAVAPSTWLGVTLAIAGSLALTRPFGETVPPGVRLGDALTLGCAVGFGVQIVLTGLWAERHAVIALTAIQLGTVFVGALLLVPFGPVRLEPTPTLAGAVAFTGLAMTAGAMAAQTWAQRHVPAERAALIFALEPVAAATFSHLLTGEALSPLDWLGGGAITAGVVIAELASARARRGPA